MNFDTVTDIQTTISFNGAFGGSTQEPVLLAAMQTEDGPDPATVRLSNLTSQEATVFIEEEASFDEEVAHTTEVVGLVGLEQGLLFASGNVAPTANPIDAGTVSEDAPVATIGLLADASAAVDVDGGILGVANVPVGEEVWWPWS